MLLARFLLIACWRVFHGLFEHFLAKRILSNSQRGTHLTSQQSLLNWPELLARVENDLELAREIAGVFETRGPELLQALTSAIAKNDVQAVFYAAHALKGTLAVFGAASTVHFLERLESEAAMGKLAGVSGAEKRLAADVQQLRQELVARFSQRS